MEGFLFWFLGTLMFLGGVMMVTQRSAVVGAVWLAFSFICAAGIFALLNAPFLAVMQILVYAGAIMVLFLFVIMMLQGPVLEGERKPLNKGLLPLIAIPPLAVVLMVVGWIKNNGTRHFAQAVEPGFGSAEWVSRLLLGKYLLAFELISIVLLVAIIGALAIGKGERKLPWK
jgi:NADH-quinone oxidoreductase subunit J|nr:NADH-quinone oxidoreductase subunit J [Candidatus Krumholzibacteria bacterium]